MESRCLFSTQPRRMSREMRCASQAARAVTTVLGIEKGSERDAPEVEQYRFYMDFLMCLANSLVTFGKVPREGNFLVVGQSDTRAPQNKNKNNNTKKLRGIAGVIWNHSGTMLEHFGGHVLDKMGMLWGLVGDQFRISWG